MLNASGCKHPCTYMQLSYEKRIYNQLKPLVNQSNIAIYYDLTDTIVTEEVLLYDLNSIVSAVGGSLGLFLGFSCFQGSHVDSAVGIVSVYAASLKLSLSKYYQSTK